MRYLIFTVLCCALSSIATASDQCATIKLPKELSSNEMAQILREISSRDRAYVAKVEYFSTANSIVKNHASVKLEMEGYCHISTDSYIFKKVGSTWELEKFTVIGISRGCGIPEEKKCEIKFIE